jgi:hypothetical protein
MYVVLYLGQCVCCGNGRKWIHNVEFHNFCCLSGSMASMKSGKMGKEYGMHGSEGNLEQIFD